MLLNHGRTGIRKSYGKLFGSVKNVIDKGISDDAEEFAKIIMKFRNNKTNTIIKKEH